MKQVTKDIFLKSISLIDSLIIFNEIKGNRVYLREWLPFVEVAVDEEYTMSFIADSFAKEDKQYLIYYKNDLGGLIGLNNTVYANNKTEIGYWIIEKMQGKDLVIQSGSKLLALAFGELKLNKVTIKVGVSNYKSRKIPEQLDFVFEGIEHDAKLLANNKYTDLAIYSL